MLCCVVLCCVVLCCVVLCCVVLCCVVLCYVGVEQEAMVDAVGDTGSLFREWVGRVLVGHPLPKEGVQILGPESGEGLLAWHCRSCYFNVRHSARRIRGGQP